MVMFCGLSIHRPILRRAPVALMDFLSITSDLLIGTTPSLRAYDTLGTRHQVGDQHAHRTSFAQRPNPRAHLAFRKRVIPA